MPGWPQRLQSLDQITEIRDHLRCAAGQVHGRNFRLREPVNQSIGGFARHYFFSFRSSVHMTMDTGEIAKFGDVNLEDFCLRVPKRQTTLGELPREVIISRQMHPLSRRDW